MNDRMDRASGIKDGTRDLFLLLLASAAGGMDALGLLGLGGVFTSALSGNTVLLGISVGQGRLGEAFLCSVVFMGFIPGAIIAAAYLRSRPKSSRWTWRITYALAAESVILLAFLVLLISAGGSDDTMTFMPLVLLSSLAMGVQYMTMLRLNVSGVTTTFVTSTVVNLVCRMVVPEKGAEGTADASRWSDRTNLFLGAVWVCYFAGAGLSAFLMGWGRVYSGLLSVALVVAVVTASAYVMARER